MLNRSCPTSASVAEVWPRLADAITSAGTHPDVRMFTVVDESSDTRRTEWELLLRGSVLHLTLDEVFDHDRHGVSLSMVHGDLAMLGGSWTVREGDDGHGAVVDLAITATFGLPLAGDVIDEHLNRALDRIIDVAAPGVLGTMAIG